MMIEQKLQSTARSLPQVTFVFDEHGQVVVYSGSDKLIEDSRHNVTAARILKTLRIPVKEFDITAAELIACGSRFPQSLEELRPPQEARQVAIVSDDHGQVAVYRGGDKLIEDGRDDMTAAEVLEALGLSVKEFHVSTAELIRFKNSFPESLRELRGAEKEKLSVSGMTLVLTGTFPQTHLKISRFLQRLGAHVREDVSKRTDYLVTGDNPGENIQARARALGVTCYEADVFWDEIGAAPEEP